MTFIIWFEQLIKSASKNFSTEIEAHAEAIQRGGLEGGFIDEKGLYKRDPIIIWEQESDDSIAFNTYVRPVGIYFDGKYYECIDR